MACSLRRVGAIISSAAATSTATATSIATATSAFTFTSTSSSISIDMTEFTIIPVASSYTVIIAGLPMLVSAIVAAVAFSLGKVIAQVAVRIKIWIIS